MQLNTYHHLCVTYYCFPKPKSMMAAVVFCLLPLAFKYAGRDRRIFEIPMGMAFGEFWSSSLRNMLFTLERERMSLAFLAHSYVVARSPLVNGLILFLMGSSLNFKCWSLRKVNHILPSSIRFFVWGHGFSQS